MKGFWDNTLKPAFEAIQTVLVDTVIPAVKQGLQEFQTKAEVVFKAVKGFWDNTLKPAIEAIKKTVVDTVVPKAKTAFDELSSKVEVVFGAIKTFWEETLKPVFDKIGGAVSTIKTGFDTTFDGVSTKVENVFNAIKGFWDNTLKPVFDKIGEVLNTLSGTWDLVFGGFQTTVNSIFGDAVGGIKDTISGALSFVEGLFANIKLELPDIPLPHFSVNWMDIAGLVSIPTISVDWYRKAMDQAYMLTNPTIFGAMGGRALGGGEAGAEMVIGRDTMMNMIRDAVGGDGTLYAEIPIYMDSKLISKYTADNAVARISRNQASALKARGAYV
jgi:hypothetical protein